MSVAFIVAGTLLIAAALAFVLVPLLRGRHAAAGDPRRAALLRAHAEGVLSDAELSAKLAALEPTDALDPPPPGQPVRPARRSAIALAVLLPASAVALYLAYGAPGALQPGAALRPAAQQPGDGQGALAGDAAPSLEQAAAGLAERMRESPDDVGGWMLLGRAYKNLQRFDLAREALSNAYRLAPQDPDVMTEYAEALTLAGSSRRIEGQAAELLDAALAAQPQHPRALWLKGIQSYQSGAFAEAAATWERLRDSLPADADVRASVQERIDDAHAQAGSPAIAAAGAIDAPAPKAATDSAATSSAAATGGASLTVQVDVDPSLKARIGPSDTLFVFARAPEGPRMPVAIQRLSAASLPVTVVLDDSTSMMPQLKLSTLPQVVVGARVSRSGQATPQAGDLEAFSDPVDSGRAAPVKLTIGRVVE